MHEIWDVFKHGVEIFAVTYIILVAIARFRKFKQEKIND